MMLLRFETSLRSTVASAENCCVSAASETPGAVPDCLAASVVAASSPMRSHVRLPVSYAAACKERPSRQAPKKADLYMTGTPKGRAPRGLYQLYSNIRSMSDPAGARVAPAFLLSQAVMTS